MFLNEFYCLENPFILYGMSFNVLHRNSLWLDTVYDFLIKLGIKPRLHILKISIVSLNHVIVRPTKKLWTEPTKIGHIFKKQSTLKIKVFNNSIYKRWSSSQIFFTEKKNQKYLVDFLCQKMTKSTNFANFEEVFHNFGRCDDDMI